MPKNRNKEVTRYLSHQPKTFDEFFTGERNGARVIYGANVGRNRKLQTEEVWESLQSAQEEVDEVEYVTGL